MAQWSVFPTATPESGPPFESCTILLNCVNAHFLNRCCRNFWNTAYYNSDVYKFQLFFCFCFEERERARGRGRGSERESEREKRVIKKYSVHFGSRQYNVLVDSSQTEEEEEEEAEEEVRVCFTRQAWFSDVHTTCEQSAQKKKKKKKKADTHTHTHTHTRARTLRRWLLLLLLLLLLPRWLGQTR